MKKLFYTLFQLVSILLTTAFLICAEVNAFSSNMAYKSNSVCVSVNQKMFETYNELNNSTGNKENFFILPESNIRYYTKEELEQLDGWQLRMAKNEIYAYHGKIFQDQEYKEYFEKQSWYHGIQDNIDENELNEYELKNFNLIEEIEQERRAFFSEEGSSDDMANLGYGYQYADILEKYQEAFTLGFDYIDNHKDQYPDIVCWAALYPDNIYYSIYDINGDEKKELLIGYKNQDMQDAKAFALFGVNEHGSFNYMNRGLYQDQTMDVYPNGIIIIISFVDIGELYYSVYSITDDGTSMKHERNYLKKHDGSSQKDTFLDEENGKVLTEEEFIISWGLYEKINELPWKKVTDFLPEEK